MIEIQQYENAYLKGIETKKVDIEQEFDSPTSNVIKSRY